MNSVDLAMKVRDICLANKVEWKININGNVEVTTIQSTPAEQGQGYYQFRGEVKENELEAFRFRMENKKPPD